jgi:hypothetical protein
MSGHSASCPAIVRWLNKSGCPLLAQSRHRLLHCTCPLLGGKADMATSAKLIRATAPRFWCARLGPSRQWFAGD